MFKKDRNEIRFICWCLYVINGWKGIRGGICHVIHRCAEEAHNKYMKDYNKINDSSYLIYLESNNLYGWTMSQKLPVGGLK